MNGEGGGPDRIRGWLDVPLSPQGKKEVNHLADKLADSGIKNIASSNLKRAHETADVIAEVTGAVVRKDMALRPWDLGKFAGEKSALVCDQINSYAKNKPDQAVPEGESFNKFKKRAFGGIVKAIDSGADAIVTHHRVERLLKAWQAQGEKPDGELCWRTFGKTGEKTASAEKIGINIGALRKAAEN